MDLSETGPRIVTAAESIAAMGCCVQKALGRLALEGSVPRLGNVLSALEEQPLTGALAAVQGAGYIEACL